MSNNAKKNKFVTYSNDMIFALVQPTGTDLANIRGRIEEAASKFNAKVEYINLTAFLDTLDSNSTSLTKTNAELSQKLSKETHRSPGFINLSTKMHHGTKLREHFGCSIFSIYGVARINISRDTLTTELLKDKRDAEEIVPPKKIYLLDSLKHPDEVDILREIYGKSFWLLGVSAVKGKRLKHLQVFRSLTEDEASELVSRDENEDEDLDFGQKMTDTFEMADFFFNESCTQNEVDRFFNIAFGNVKIAPHRDEQFMHVSASIAAQSSDLSRQVGAVIVSKSGELLSIGCNDVPKFPGGQYKEGDSPDYRDVTIGHDPNHRRRDQILENIPTTTDRKTKDMIKNLIEYHRAVHAEMEAVISCARRGLSTVDAVLYTTTYPCHNCAKHLLNAGIRKVIYIQAYTKYHNSLQNIDYLMLSDQFKVAPNKI